MRRKPEKVKCLRCGGEFERRLRSGYFCKPCIGSMDDREELERRKVRRDLADGVLERHGLSDWIPKLNDERLEEIGLATEDGQPAMRDALAPLEGAISEYGPEEGRSTFFKDLAGELDELSTKASEDPWWTSNKYWHYALSDPGKAAVFLSRLGDRCREARGSHAGYNRHRRAKEMPCPACSEAERVYVSDRRSDAA